MIRVSVFFVVFVVFVVMVTACSSAPEVELPEEVAALENVSVYSADSKPVFELTLTKEAAFGDTDDLFLGGWLSSVTDHEGRVFVADGQETKLHLYNPDGSYNRQISREGDGPGEYRNLGPMHTDDQYLHILDYQLNRITRYDLQSFEVTGETSISIEQEGDGGFYRSPQDFYLTGSDEYVIVIGSSFSRDNASNTDRSLDGLTISWSGESLSDDNLFSFDASEALVHVDGGSMMVMMVPYKRSTVIAYHDNRLVHGWNEHYLFSVYDQNGEYERSIYYPYQNMPLERDEVLNMYDDRDAQWFSMVQNDDMPDVWPSWKTFSVDDEGRLWVERLVDDHEQTVLHLMSDSGELLGTAPWNSDKNIQDIKNGYLYSSEENEMGLREIVKYSVSME